MTIAMVTATQKHVVANPCSPKTVRPLPRRTTVARVPIAAKAAKRYGSAGVRSMRRAEPGAQTGRVARLASATIMPTTAKTTQTIGAVRHRSLVLIAGIAGFKPQPPLPEPTLTADVSADPRRHQALRVRPAVAARSIGLVVTLALAIGCSSGRGSRVTGSSSTLVWPTTVDTTPPPVDQCATKTHAPQVAPVLVIARDVQRGERGSDLIASAGLRCALIIAEFRPASGIADPALIRDLYAIAPLSAGQVVVEGMFVTRTP